MELAETGGMKSEGDMRANTSQGAAFTFNLPSYLSFLQQLRLPLSPNPPSGIPFPTFDHHLKDPSTSPHPILPRHRIVVLEGLYTMLDRDGWRECAEIMDMRVWVECDREVCRRRTITRNLAAGIVDSMEKCEARGMSLSRTPYPGVFPHALSHPRTPYTALDDTSFRRLIVLCEPSSAVADMLVDASDVVNGDEVADHKYKPTEIIHCIDSEKLVNGNGP